MREGWLEGRETHQGIYSGINKQCDDDMEYRERLLTINLWLIIRTLVVDIWLEVQATSEEERSRSVLELERGAKEMKEVHTSYFSSPPSLRESD